MQLELKAIRQTDPATGVIQVREQQHLIGKGLLESEDLNSVLDTMTYFLEHHRQRLFDFFVGTLAGCGNDHFPAAVCGEG